MLGGMATPDWELLGPIVRTQIHTDRMVQNGTYHQEKIIEVDELHLSTDGVVGVRDGQAILHGHHRLHPNKTRAERPRSFMPARLLSVGFTGHYAAINDYFGTVPLGCAAEDILVDTELTISEADLAAGIQLRGTNGVLDIGGASVAEPCVPFTKFLLRTGGADHQVDIARAFLQKGMRGFVLGVPEDGTPFTLAVGDEVWRRTG